MKVTKYFWNGAEIRWESGVGSNIKQFLLRTSGVYTVQQVQQVQLKILYWKMWIREQVRVKGEKYETVLAWTVRR